MLSQAEYWRWNQRLNVRDKRLNAEAGARRDLRLWDLGNHLLENLCCNLFSFIENTWLLCVICSVYSPGEIGLLSFKRFGFIYVETLKQEWRLTLTTARCVFKIKNGDNRGAAFFMFLLIHFRRFITVSWCNKTTAGILMNHCEKWLKCLLVFWC